MKNYLILIILIYSFGCTTTKTSVQQISVEQTLMNIPIRITENNSAGNVVMGLNISGFKNKSVETNITGHTTVNEYGIFEVEKISDNLYREHAGVNRNQFKGNNYNWKLPEISVMGNIDIIASKYFCLFGGINYNLINNNENWSKYFGLGFYNERDKFAYRIDFGLFNNNSKYLIEYVKIEDKEISGDMTRDVWFYKKESSDNYWGTFLSFTYNTKRNDWLINLFANYTVGIQVLYDIDLPIDVTTDKFNFNLNSTVHSFSTGIYQTISENFRITIGAKYLRYKIDNSKADNLNYFTQLDFVL